MAEHQRNYPDPVNPSDGGSLWEPTTSGRRSSEWPEAPGQRHDPDSASTQAEQWNLGDDRDPDRESTRHMAAADPQVVDPELAALAGGEPRTPLPPDPRGPLPPTYDDVPRRGPMPPVEPPTSGGPHGDTRREPAAGPWIEPHHDPGPHTRSGPPPMPPGQRPAPPMHPGQAPVDPPTQAYPSMPRGPERRTEPVNRRPVPPAEVVEGVYRKKRPALALAVAILSGVAAVPALVLLVRSMFGHDFSASGIVAGILLIIGIPLIGAGLSPLIGSGPRVGGREMSALMRPPYVYLVTGLVLVLAAGLAA